MLIDFADLLQINVYTLGQTVMGVREKIGQYIPVADPVGNFIRNVCVFKLFSFVLK